MADVEPEFATFRHPRSAVVPPALTACGLAGCTLAVATDHPVDELARSFAETGRVRIANFLAEGALALHDQLQTSGEWIHLITAERGVDEIDPRARVALGRSGMAARQAEAQQRSTDRFGYSYEAIAIPAPEEAAASADLIDRFALLMASAPMRALLGAITGVPVQGFTDGQATAYGPGDFLTVHDDAVDGKDRTAAFVLGLTPGWRLDWGGLLLFHGERDRDALALPPMFNTLDLFAVPRRHSVSLVSPAAPHRRYALTGWLR